MVVKKCCRCQKEMKSVESWVVICKKCFDKYKTQEKTANNYVVLTGKHAGKSYLQLKENHAKYIVWVLEADFKEDSPMAWVQHHFIKFQKEENMEKLKKSIKKKDVDELSVYDSEEEELIPESD